MSQTPVLFPGAALSRNSVMRNSAVQASAYVTMDASMARLPVTVDDALTSTGACPLVANKARFARLKFRDPAEMTGYGIYNLYGTMSAGTANIGSAIYEYRPKSRGFTLVFVQGSFATVTGPSFIESVINFSVPIKFDRTKTYVVGVVNSAPSLFTGNGIIHNISGANDLFVYYQATSDVTIATGWPTTLNFNGAKSAGDFFSTYRSNMFSMAMNVNYNGSSSVVDQLTGLMY
jgi:hypothetical protein